MSERVFAAGFKTTPYWWDAAPPPRPETPDDVPDRTDAVVVGGGLTGLSAALELARSGVRTVVLDRETIGWGASTRNGGQLSGGFNLGRGLKRGQNHLETVLGPERVGAMLDEAAGAFEQIEAVIRREGIACDFKHTGRFIGAHVPKAYETLARRVDSLNSRGPDEAVLVPPERVSSEIDTRLYHGGMVVRRSGALHPAKYTQSLAAAARRAGAILIGGTEMKGIEAREGSGDRFTVQTSRGPIRTREIVVATNGYTGGATPWHRRRLVPVASFMIATEEIGEDRVRALLPRGRVYGDTKRVLYYYRPSPDGRRILFGGRASFTQVDERRSSAILHRFLTGLLPGLSGVRITHGWKGNVAFSFDHLPHIGVRDGVHHVLGCNGSGVVMMSYLGQQAALRILGSANRPTAFADLPFPTRPFYDGRPWFMPAIGSWYRLRDRLDGWRTSGRASAR